MYPTYRIANPTVIAGFNWTAYYQQDSTVYWPYGWFKKRPAPVNITRNYASGKHRKVLWVVSRCDTINYQRREHYVAEV